MTMLIINDIFFLSGCKFLAKVIYHMEYFDNFVFGKQSGNRFIV